MKMIVTSRDAIIKTQEKMSQEVHRYQKEVDDSRINSKYDSGYYRNFTKNKENN